MTLPRSQLVSPAQTPYYHCIARCVRRSWLCGDDAYTGKNFDHRKPWLLERMTLLTRVFAIHIAGYSVMSNHYHLVLYLDTPLSTSLSDEQVIDRWHLLYSGPSVVRRYRNHETLAPEQLDLVQQNVACWRERLSSISWFMRCLNEHIARRANGEDGCKGRFWEGRFKSQALLDEQALLACMVYVDLNPIRAGIAVNLDGSDYTSIQARIDEVKCKAPAEVALPTPTLLPFTSTLKQDQISPAIPFRLQDYLQLVDWTGRWVRKDKKGVIAPEEPKLLQQLGLNDIEWQHLALVLQKKAIRTMHGWERVQRLRVQKSQGRIVSK